MSILSELAEKHPLTDRFYDRIYMARLAFLCRFFPLAATRYLYRKYLGKELNLEAPQDFNEKLLWLKHYWQHPLVETCADKYEMRGYVENLGYGHLLPRLIGVYDDPREIDWDALPDRFVLKCNHGCGFNILCPDKRDLDTGEATARLKRWMKTDYSVIAAEFHYARMKPRILCEEFLDDQSGVRPTDYKVYCFDGKAHCILACTSRDLAGHAKFDFYDRDWTRKLEYSQSSLRADRVIPRPDALPAMIEASEALSKPFPFVRMDFYNINNQAVLGEMTFTPMGCMETGYTDLGQEALGALVRLPARQA